MEPGNTATADLLDWLNDSDVTISVHLAKNDIAADLEAITLATFTECDFPGYAPKVSPTFLPDTPLQELHGNTVTEMLDWVADGITEPQRITAVYVKATKGTDAELLQAYLLDRPVTIWEDGQRYSKRIRVESADDNS